MSCRRDPGQNSDQQNVLSNQIVNQSIPIGSSNSFQRPNHANNTNSPVIAANSTGLYVNKSIEDGSPHIPRSMNNRGSSFPQVQEDEGYRQMNSMTAGLSPLSPTISQMEEVNRRKCGLQTPNNLLTDISYKNSEKTPSSSFNPNSYHNAMGNRDQLFYQGGNQCFNPNYNREMRTSNFQGTKNSVESIIPKPQYSTIEENNNLNLPYTHMFVGNDLRDDYRLYYQIQSNPTTEFNRSDQNNSSIQGDSSMVPTNSKAKLPSKENSQQKQHDQPNKKQLQTEPFQQPSNPLSPTLYLPAFLSSDSPATQEYRKRLAENTKAMQAALVHSQTLNQALASNTEDRSKMQQNTAFRNVAFPSGNSCNDVSDTRNQGNNSLSGVERTLTYPSPFTNSVMVNKLKTTQQDTRERNYTSINLENGKGLGNIEFSSTNQSEHYSPYVYNNNTSNKGSNSIKQEVPDEKHLANGERPKRKTGKHDNIWWQNKQHVCTFKTTNIKLYKWHTTHLRLDSQRSLAESSVEVAKNDEANNSKLKLIKQNGNIHGSTLIPDPTYDKSLNILRDTSTGKIVLSCPAAFAVRHRLDRHLRGKHPHNYCGKINENEYCYSFSPSISSIGTLGRTAIMDNNYPNAYYNSFGDNQNSGKFNPQSQQQIPQHMQMYPNLGLVPPITQYHLSPFDVHQSGFITHNHIPVAAESIQNDSMLMPGHEPGSSTSVQYLAMQNPNINRGLIINTSNEHKNNDPKNGMYVQDTQNTLLLPVIDEERRFGSDIGQLFWEKN